ncbi:hypothetical protein PsorP6_011359 [Peronosclerospora sorghi]|uniref:Uncharacterized protein n=1 Tax=Peronosclerospora sorghi TaxID=230839 RepID=A0ACC0WMF7_9STRA|nr:hypothetical protein PsorP6_011359 [Peronosclerospora sorghi]
MLNRKEIHVDILDMTKRIVNHKAEQLHNLLVGSAPLVGSSHSNLSDAREVRDNALRTFTLPTLSPNSTLN